MTSEYGNSYKMSMEVQLMGVDAKLEKFCLESCPYDKGLSNCCFSCALWGTRESLTSMIWMLESAKQKSTYVDGYEGIVTLVVDKKPDESVCEMRTVPSLSRTSVLDEDKLQDGLWEFALQESAARLVSFHIDSIATQLGYDNLSEIIDKIYRGYRAALSGGALYEGSQHQEASDALNDLNSLLKGRRKGRKI